MSQPSIWAVPLSDRRVIEVRGDDAAAWLQGQVTQDLRGLDASEARYSFVLSPQGRVLADLWALRPDDDRFFVVVPASAHDGLLERLSRYVIMEDVELRPLPDARALWLIGASATGDTSDLDDHVLARRVEHPQAGTLVLAMGPGAEATLEALVARTSGATRATARTDDERARLYLQLGLPRFGVDFGPDNLPQETGLTAHAVSFHKGCYLGQEPVVMLEHRGSAPKRLVCMRVATAVAPPTGAPVMSGESVAGHVTSSAAERGDPPTCLAFAFVKRAHLGTTDFMIDGLAAQVVAQ